MNPRSTRALPALFPLALLAFHLPAQGTWVPLSDSVPALTYSGTWDSLRDRALLAGPSGEVLEFDGDHWLAAGRLPATSFGPFLEFQTHRGRTLALVNRANTTNFETWEYDGAEWRMRVPDHSPTPRVNTMLAYDSLRQRVVLFGGTRGTRVDDTWEWDGNDWLRRLPALRPAARDNAGMCFDPTRGVTMLVCGRTETTFLSDHWEWDGTNWVQRNLAVLPQARTRGKLVFDATRSRTVFYGGQDFGATTLYEQPWEFDGQQWQLRSINSAPPGRTGHTMVGAPGGVRIFGGLNAPIDQRAEIWDYDGSQFTPRHGPIVAWNTAAFDATRNRDVVVGWPGFVGFPTQLRTFEWDGDALAEVLVPGPSQRTNPMMADGMNGRVLLFGGAWTSGLLNDTWTYDGNTWQQVAASGPPARIGGALATDTARNVVVLYGGYVDPATILADTWEWNGASWTQQAFTGPGPRFYAPMAFDQANSRIVLHGGQSSFTGYDDTWSYTAAGWQQINSGGPIGQFLAWSGDFGGVVLATNPPTVEGTTKTYILQGSAWIELWMAEKDRRINQLVQDPNGHLLGLGGVDGLSRTLFTTRPGTVEPLYVACSNVGTPPIMVLHDRPRPGTTLRLELVRAEPGQIALLAASYAWGQFTVVGNCHSPLMQPTLVGVTSTNLAGQAMVPIAVPNNPALLDVYLALQYGVGETAGPIGGTFALSSSLLVKIGD
ncbi:MAG: hypothetical protein KDE27_25055 [Planctomycetes bacterium]|nr:hypothetical protein [Planctomycetota bacterium]